MHEEGPFKLYARSDMAFAYIRTGYEYYTAVVAVVEIPFLYIYQHFEFLRGLVCPPILTCLLPLVVSVATLFRPPLII